MISTQLGMINLPSIYDLTGGQLADVPGVTPAVIGNHAYPWEAVQFTKPLATAIALPQRRPLVMYDWECWAINSTHPSFTPHLGSVDPAYDTLRAIQSRHQTYADAIAKITPLADQRGVRLGIYSYLSLTHKRLEDVAAGGLRHAQWRVEQDAVLRLPVTVDGEVTTLLKLLNRTEGHVYVLFYVPSGWNVNTPGFLAKVRRCFSRLCEPIKEAGGNAMPLLSLTCADNAEPVLIEVQRVAVEVAKEQGAFAVWSRPGEVTPEFKALIAEGEK